ncbi:MAG: 2-aminoethylphosphonate--pyruvate transaminase [Alphaproteobacteria bacterium]|nr:2-aminoethylphosphonate--pyruvate transaminase [Alphaproteobacteria bacterium]
MPTARLPMAAKSETGDPLLLTPGPLTTSKSVKTAMLHDWGSRDATFIRVNKEMRERITEAAGGKGTHTTVPMQGSGTFAVEAMIGSFVPKNGKLLILVNGAYGTRAVKICQYASRAHQVLETPEDTPPDLAKLEAALKADAAITHVLVVHCETTSGILNPVAEVAAIVAKAGRRMLIDSMSAFGALPIDAREVKFDALASSSTKCLEGVPGFGFIVCDLKAVEQAKGNAHSLALDVHDQCKVLETTGQYRFTPPIHAIVALHQAITEFVEEGGVAGRGGRYRQNAKVLIDGMRAMGFDTLLPDRLQAPIIVTFHMPRDPKFHFQTFYDRLKDLGYVIYPGKLTVADSFRIGCIGRLSPDHMRGAVETIRAVIADMGVSQLGAKRAA